MAQQAKRLADRDSDLTPFLLHIGFWKDYNLQMHRPLFLIISNDLLKGDSKSDMI